MSALLRVVLADDELMARRRLGRLLRDCADVEVVGECQDGAEALKRVAQGGVDVLLLDVHMPNLDGVSAAHELVEGGPYVIFCTAHAEHAVEAFDAGAVDYLLKPVELGRLRRALDRARARLASRAPQAEEPRRAAPRPRLELDRLALTTRAGIVLLDPSRVSHAVLEGELVTVATTDCDHLTELSLSELEARLPASFVRVHRRALLNLEHVVRLEPTPAGGFVARTARGDGVQVSRQAARELRRLLGLRPGAGADGRDG